MNRSSCLVLAAAIAFACGGCDVASPGGAEVVVPDGAKLVKLRVPNMV